MSTRSSKIVNKIYIIILFAVAALQWWLNGERMPVACVLDDSHSRAKMFAMEYLVPRIADDINKVFGLCIALVAVIFWLYLGLSSEAELMKTEADKTADKKSKKPDKNRNVVYNLLYICAAIVLIAYMIIFYQQFSCVSWIFIIYGILAVAGLVIAIANAVTYIKNRKELKLKTPWVSALIVLLMLVLGIAVGIYKSTPVIKQTKETARELFAMYTLSMLYTCFAEDEEQLETYIPYVRVCFVNMMSGSGQLYSYDELVEEYKNFMNGSGSWDTLWDFCDESIRVELKHIRYEGNNVIYSAYDVFDMCAEYDEAYYPFTEHMFWNASDLTLEYLDFGDDLEKPVTGYHTYDVKFFGGCVEKNLNYKGLTLLPRSGEDAVGYTKYEEAQLEDVQLACEEVAAMINTDYQYIDTVTLELNQLSVGDEFDFTNNNTDFVVDRARWEKVSKVGEAGGLGTLGIEGKVEANSIYRVCLEVHLPLGYYTDDNVKLELSGLDCEKTIILQSDAARHDNKVNVTLWFTTGESEE